jgi:hypothetical protein
MHDGQVEGGCVMTVTVVALTKNELIERRDDLLAKVSGSADDLRSRVLAEAATADERAILVTLDEIAFLLDDDQ